MLFSISLLACATLLLWQLGGTWVDQFDVFVVKKYQENYQKRLDSAVSTAARSPKEGVVLLGQFLDDVSEIKKKDRLDRVKRTAFVTIIKVLNNTDRQEEALAWAERWAEFDDRDLFAQVWRAKLMRTSPGRLEEGWLLISEWYRKIPHSSLIANEYAEYLLGRENFTDAFLVAYRLFEQQDSLTGQTWQVFWDMGSGLQKKDVVPEIDASGRLSFRLDVPAGIVSLRIDPPTNSRISLVDPVLTDNETAPGKSFSLMDIPLGLSQMVRNERTLVTTGGNDPYFSWDMSGVKTSGGKLFFVCTVEEAPPVILEKIFKLADPVVVENELRERQELDAAKTFRVLAEKSRSLAISSSFQDAFFELFWTGSGEDLSEERKVRQAMVGSVDEGSYKFEVVFPVAARAKKVRIDLPDIPGKKYTFKAIELVGDGWSQQVDLNSMDDRLSHMVARQGANFEVLGSDPYFIFSALSGDRIIESVIIRGGAL